MTYAPARLLELRHYLQPLTGLADYELGIVGDTAHIGGYHHGWDQRRIVNGVTSDYSWNESTRDSSHKTNAASAFDVGMFGRLREFSVWLAQQCAAGTADTQDIREVIYSPDGVTVKRWDRLGRRTSGDSSHLTHTHISFFRDAEDRDKTAVFRRFFEGGSMRNFDGVDRSAERELGDIFDQLFGGIYSGKFPNSHGALLLKLVASAAADETRDAATLAAIQALAGNGGPDAAPIIAAIEAEANATRDLVEQRHAAEMAELARLHAGQLAERDADIAGLRAELERLTGVGGVEQVRAES